MAEVEIERHEGWAEVVLNRPERKNAINGPLGVALERAITNATAEPACGAILFRGAEGAFCSGLDLKAFNEEPAPEWLEQFQTIWRGAHRALFDCPVPIVCAMERFAINGGAALALAADLLVAGEGGFLQVGEIQQGMAAPYNVAWLNLRAPETVRARLIFTGRRFSGRELQEMGLAHECVSDEDVLATARSLCEQLGSFPEGGSRRIKAGLRAHVQASADAWFDAAVAADPIQKRLSPGFQRG